MSMNAESQSVVTISSANNPDLDWSQVMETVRMLNLAVAQITISMRDGDDSVAILGDSFTSTAQQLEDILSLVDQLPEDQQSVSIKPEIKESCLGMLNQINKFVVAFQFYDKLSQRMAHVSHSLAELGDLVADQNRLFHPSEWHQLQVDIGSHYTMTEERQMFQAVMNGASVEEALAGMYDMQAFQSDQTEEIELF